MSDVELAKLPEFEWGGRGLGRELLNWEVSDLRVRGAARIEFTVEAANDRRLTLHG
jgi:ribosomal protein S18 acetylase RimI-like enzyme